MSEIDSQPFPKAALIAATALVGITLALTGAVSAGLIAKPLDAETAREQSHMPIREQRVLTFVDRPGGALEIRDVGRQTLVRVIEPGEKSGFIRGLLRSFGRERRMFKAGPEAPYRLTLWADNSLSITDLATKRTVELGSFGPDNRAAFAALLPSQTTHQVAAR